MIKLLYPATNVVNEASVATSRKYPVAPETAPQFTFIEVQVKLEAAVAVGAIGAVVLAEMVLEYKLMSQPLPARTR